MKAVILDRDGTLIDVVRDEETGTISTAFHPAQIRILPGVIEGLRLLRDAGFAFAIATNQPGPAKGHFSVTAVERTNEALVKLLADEGLAIASVAVCTHHPDGAPGGDAALVRKCDCRKPAPGMLEALLARHGFAREQSWMIGDSTQDVEAGRAAGLRTGLLFPDNRCELCPLRPSDGGAPAPPGPPLAAGMQPRTPDLYAATLRGLAKAIVALG